MIREVKDSIFADRNENSVIINPVNCKASIQPGITSQICKNIPGWFDDFNKYCSWFNKSTWVGKNHFEEIIGTFHRFEVNDKTLICSVFVQTEPVKSKFIDGFENWIKVLKKIRRQTQRVKQLTGKTWTLHISMNVCMQQTLDGDTLMPILEELFGDSDVDIVIHE